MGQRRYGSVLCAVVVCTISFCDAALYARLVPDSHEIWSDKKYVDLSVVIDPSGPHIDVAAKVLQPLPEIDVHIESHVRSKDNANHYHHTNTTFSLCDMLRLKASHPMAVLVFAAVKRFGNIPEKCPIGVGTYSLSKAWVPEHSVPQNIPKIELDMAMQLFVIDNGQRTLIIKSQMAGHTVQREGEPPAGRQLFSLLSKG